MLFRSMGDTQLLADLIMLELEDLDVILGMDWLGRYHAVVNCFTKEVVLISPDQQRVVFSGERQVVPSCLISAVQAFRLIRGGCGAYLAHVVDTRLSGGQIEDIPVVREFPDVFPEELPGLPPEREIEFSIDLAPGTAPDRKSTRLNSSHSGESRMPSSA